MGKVVTLTNIKKYRRNFNNHPTSKISMNAATRTDLRKVAMNWDAFRDIDHTFSDKVSGEMKATSQMRSGRFGIVRIFSHRNNWFYKRIIC